MTAPQTWNPDEYEEISAEEVDRVVAALDQLAQSVESDSIRVYLEEALANVHTLFYDDETDDEPLPRSA